MFYLFPEQSVGKIDTVSTIAGLVQLLQKTKNEETRRKVAEILGEIGKGDSETIAGLVQLLQKTKNEETRRKVAEILGEIG
ncbi:MAG: HEAT repeat domain-containing protein, partial [Hormoscilla sp. GM102CHS1]|nr:HEAT repeat domain-containing protein [Hormoscilla sp. GM102CHS1]